jgi:predicted GNAT family acetyltransferase
VIVRHPKIEEMDQVYLMGFDTWGEKDGKTQQEHIEECKTSPRYAEGTWYVLEDEQLKKIVSSLIVHPLKPWQNFEVRGIGTVATHPEYRRKGYGSEILTQVILKLEGQNHVGVILIGADDEKIRDYYNRLGFQVLPDSFQRPGQPILMAHTSVEFKLMALTTAIQE